MGAAIVSVLLVVGAVIWGVVSLNSPKQPDNVAANDSRDVTSPPRVPEVTRTTNRNPIRPGSRNSGHSTPAVGGQNPERVDPAVSGTGVNESTTQNTNPTTAAQENTNRPPVINPPRRPTVQRPDPKPERPAVGVLTSVTPVIIGQTPISPADISDMRMSPDGNHIVIQNILQPIRYWERGVGFTWHEFNGHARAVSICGISADSRLAITCSGTETHVWDLRTGETKTVVEARSDSGAVSQDGSRLALLKSGRVYLYSMGSGQELGKMDLGYSGQTMRLGADDKTMISIGSMHDVAVHDTSGNQLKHWKVEGGGFSNGHIAADGSRVLVLHSSDASVLDTESGRILAHWHENISSSDGAISADGNIAVISNSTELRIIDMSDPDDVKWMQYVYPKRAYHRAQIAMSADGSLLVSTISNQKVGEIWDLKAMMGQAGGR